MTSVVRAGPRGGPASSRSASRHAQLAARSRRCPGLGASGPGRPGGTGRVRLPVQPDDQRLRQHVLLGGRPGRLEELDGVVLRLVRRRELHHRRQAAAGDDADGPLGPAVRAELVEHPAARGAGRRRDGRPAVRRRPPFIRADRRDDRRPRDDPHPGRGPDLPLQQSRRAADPPVRRRGVGRPAGHRVRPAALDRRHGDPRGLRLQHEVPAGLPRRAGLRHPLADRRPGLPPPADRRPPAGRP